jgi:hypothetical protein
MVTRSAEATIRGYYYQFDTTILKLLTLDRDADSVAIEGIEDIDIMTATESTAVQCKYLSKSKFINSAVREPIVLMLNHFVNPHTANDLQYILYAHFENETPGSEPTINLKKLKEILTYKEAKVEKHYEIENGISDTSLEKFLAQFKFVFGTEFLAQQQQVINLFKKKFNCSAYEADNHFYNNALRVVIDLAIKKAVVERTITKKNFLQAVDTRKILFNSWFIQLRSKKEYLKQSVDTLKTSKALLPSKSKTILISKELLSADHKELPIDAFVENLISRYYKWNTSLSTAKPLTFILDCNETKMKEIKRSLLTRQIVFNDGYETIEFSSHHFNREPVNNTTRTGKLSKSSFQAKIISKATWDKHISTIDTPSVLINFLKDQNLSSISAGQKFSFPYCENLSDASYLLNS